jgi:signal transduction histidine kinase
MVFVHSIFVPVVDRARTWSYRGDVAAHPLSVTKAHTWSSNHSLCCMLFDRSLIFGDGPVTLEISRSIRRGLIDSRGPHAMQELMHQEATRRRILLVEDDSDLCEALGETLQDHGHTVVSAANGEDGLRRMREFRPDVVVLDLMMPKVDGWQFRIAQRSDPALVATPIVVISASNSPAALAVDADMYLRKPLDAETLVNAIEGVLHAQQRRAESANLAQTERLAALGTLAAGLAHEINNPLTYVLLELGQAVRMLPSLATEQNQRVIDQVDKLMKDALEGAERIRGITSAIRTFSRPDDTRLRPVDIREPIDAALKLAMSEIRRRARLKTSYDDPFIVLANGGQLAQVFLNLLANAAQAIPEGRVDDNEIRVEARIIDDSVIVEIADTGAGIPQHLLGRVFEPFFSTKPVGQGTGLGLSISHNIITAFGGQIGVTSAVGIGTTFRVQLPAPP